MALPQACLGRESSGLFGGCFNRRRLISGVCRRLQAQPGALVFGARGLSSRLFGRRFIGGLENGGGLARTGERVGTGVTRWAIAAAASGASAPGFPAALRAGSALGSSSALRAGSGLGPVGGDDLGQLAVLKQLGHRAQGEAQGCHGGAQAKGLLDGSGGAQFVFAEADAEAAGFPVAAFPSSPLTGAIATALTTAFTTTALPSATEATVLLALGAG